MNLISNQTKYEYIKAVNFTIDQWNQGFKQIMWKCIQYITKENLLLLKDLLDVYIDKLDEIVNKYKNAHLRTIEMKPVDVNCFNKKYIKESSKFKVGDNVRVANIDTFHFCKMLVPNWSEEESVIKKGKSTVSCICFISDLNAEEILRTFYEK